VTVSTRGKGTAGAKTTRDSASEKKAKMNEGFTAAERCAERLARESEAERYARDDRDLTLGEQVLRNPLIRDLSIQGLNPFKLSDLQSVLGLREFYRLLPDVDLKECYFEGAWRFRKDEFVLANWREMDIDIEDMKHEVKWAHPELVRHMRVYPPGKVDVKSLRTKEEIVRMFWELTYVPAEVYLTAVAGAHVLRSVTAGDVGDDPAVVREYLEWACRAGLDASVIRGLAEVCGEEFIDEAAPWAAGGGHTDVVDLLASEFGAEIEADCLYLAAMWGQDAMIDHLVEEYGVDPNGAAEYGSALHYAAEYGRVHTVKHLVEKHKVDIHKRDMDGDTALDHAEVFGRTECAAYLRELTYTQLLAGQYRGDVRERLLCHAARGGNDAMIDLLVERYGVDPNGAGENGGWTALHEAAMEGRVRTVKHLVEKHKVDIHQRNGDGETALDFAEMTHKTALADYLRELMSTRPPTS